RISVLLLGSMGPEKAMTRKVAEAQAREARTTTGPAHAQSERRREGATSLAVDCPGRDIGRSKQGVAAAMRREPAENKEGEPVFEILSPKRRPARWASTNAPMTRRKRSPSAIAPAPAAPFAKKAVRAASDIAV